MNLLREYHFVIQLFANQLSLMHICFVGRLQIANYKMNLVKSVIDCLVFLLCDSNLVNLIHNGISVTFTIDTDFSIS